MKFLLLLTVSPCILYLLHGLLSRLILALRLKISSGLVALLAVLAGFAAVCALSWVLFLSRVTGGAELVCGWIFIALVYGCFADAYMHLFLMGETARRLHILYELKVHGAMSRAQIAQRYGASQMLDARLNRLLSMQQIRREGNRYILRKRFLWLVSKALIGWGHVLGFHPEALR